MILLALPLVLGLATGVLADAANVATVPTEPKDRVAYHLRAVDELSEHFDGVLRSDCPRFAMPVEWKSYFDGEVGRVVLLLAHLEQAWIEAKKSPDDELRRTAKAPRKRIGEARALVDKLQVCADQNGAPFAPLLVWSRIEREVPKKQAEIALPE
jgi:hypothetical protein